MTTVEDGVIQADLLDVDGDGVHATRCRNFLHEKPCHRDSRMVRILAGGVVI